MDTKVRCEVYTYVANSAERYNFAHPSIGWTCACGARCEKPNHPSRAAAERDWQLHERTRPETTHEESNDE